MCIVLLRSSANALYKCREEYVPGKWYTELIRNTVKIQPPQEKSCTYCLLRQQVFYYDIHNYTNFFQTDILEQKVVVFNC